VIPVVVGSSPIGHPSLGPRRWRAPALRGATAQAAFHAVRHAALAQVGANARGVLESRDPEFLHQLRVGLRRLRSALRAWRDVLPAKAAKPLARSLRRFSPRLGAARDWDVLVARMEAGAAPLELLAQARRRRAGARRAARRAVASKAFARAMSEARAIAAAGEPESLREIGCSALARAHRKLFKQKRIPWSDAAERHAMRVRVKRLRYSCEFFAPAFPARRSAAYLADLKELQEILGELNDIAVGRRLLGFDADEAALLRKLRAAWARFAKRPVFWRAPE